MLRRFWRESIWAGRAVVLLGLVLVIIGCVLYGNAPPSSRHYHDNPTPGDLNGYSLILMCGVGVGLALWGYTRNDPRRREWRRNHDGSDG